MVAAFASGSIGRDTATTSSGPRSGSFPAPNKSHDVSSYLYLWPTVSKCRTCSLARGVLKSIEQAFLLVSCSLMRYKKLLVETTVRPVLIFSRDPRR